MKMDLKWIDLYKMVLEHHNQTESVTHENLGEVMLSYLEHKYCGHCPKCKMCHDVCVTCDEMSELLERIGFEV